MKKIKNISAKVDSIVEIKSPGWIYLLHKNNELHIDNEKLQRLKKKWEEGKVNSYLTTLFNGASLKDTIQLAKISTIIEKLKSDLESETDSIEIEFLEDNLKYFESISNKTYLVLDGQHRIYEIVEYFDGNTVFSPTQPIEYQVEGESGKIVIRGKFKDLNEDVQYHLKSMIPLIVVTYNTGDLKELVNVFITSNSMVAMSAHEKRILNYNQNNRWLVELCNYDTNVKSMFKSIGAGMTSDYDLLKKGDTLFVAEMLLYINDNYYENESSKLDQALGSTKSNIKPKDKNRVYVSSKDRELTKKIIKTMADGCALYDTAKLKKYGKSTFYNLFYTLSYFMQKGNVWGKTKKIDGAYEISKLKKFITWFFDMEFDRLNAPGTYMKYKTPSGKIKRQMHDYSFAKHNADQKHKSKESMKGQGGSIYNFSDYARLRYLLEDLNSNIENLLELGIISKLGSRDSEMSRDEFLVAHNIKLSESDNLHLDEIVPVKKGGDRTIENTRFVDSKTNINDSDRIKKII